jgi:hypothetical protein
VASGKRSPLTVAGAAVGWHPHPAVLDAYHIPSLLSRSREAIKGGSTTSRPHIVNGNPDEPAFGPAPARTIVVAGRMHYPD